METPRTATKDRLLAAAASLFIAAWFLFFAGAGLWAPFSGDDLMNLHGHLSKSLASNLLSNVAYWSDSHRPMGGLFYVVIYRLFGFDPLPFRVVCFFLLGFNLILLYEFCRLLSGSSEVATLAALLAGYHAWFVDLYYSSGTVYDLLCFAFYFSAFVYYVRIRQQGRYPSGLRQWLAFTGLYIAALNSKEMAVTLPLFIGVYEWVYFRPKTRPSAYRQWLGREGRPMLLGGLLTIPYVIGKLATPAGLGSQPLYRPSISAGRFLDTFHLYLNPLFYREYCFRDPNTIQLLLAMLLFAAATRSRSLLFGWSFLLLSTLPSAFISHYAAFFLYIPIVGGVLYGATAIVTVRDFLFGLLRRAGAPEICGHENRRRTLQVFTFLALAAILAPLHARESAKTMRHFRSVQPPSREMITELARVQPSVAKGARILFVDDPFDRRGHFLVFLSRLFYHDMTLQVERTAVKPVPASDYGKYEAVFLVREGRLEKLR